jgi:hypothetical protein
MKPGTAKPRHESQVAAAAQRLPLIGWCLAATLAVIILQLAGDSRSLFDTLGNSDDATRLIQVRAFLAGSGWFNTTLDAFGGVQPLNSHWSRLIDAPIAALITTLHLFTDQPSAEFAARVIWPALLLLALSYGIARAAEVEAGRPAAVAALVLLIGAFLATTPFWTGRIDHHSAMILTSVAGVILLTRSFSNPTLAAPAGISLALSLAIGFESLALIGVALVTFVTIAGVLTRNQDIAKTAAIAFAATIFLAFLITVPPNRWFVASCDALSINLVVLSSFAATGVWTVVTQTSPDHRRLRLILLAAAAIIAASAALAFEPRCLMGPFGQTDPRLNTIWLDHVAETQSIDWLWQRLPAIAVTYGVSCALGIAAASWLAWQERKPGSLFTACVVTAVAIVGLLQVKLIPYAAVLTLPSIAVAIVRLPSLAPLSRTATQCVALFLSLQVVISVLAHAGVGVPIQTANELQADKACRTHQAIRPLQDLPPGRMISDLNIASAIIAGSNLKAFAAPYHRLDRQILKTAEIFESDTDRAIQHLNEIGAKYVAICTNQRGTNVSGLKLALAENSLRARLSANRPPDNLTRLELSGPTPIQVWQLKDAANQSP